MTLLQDFFGKRYKKREKKKKFKKKIIRRKIMANMLTTKECTLIGDLLTLEENACKKARLYSRIMTDPALAEKMGKIADNHEKRFNALLEML